MAAKQLSGYAGPKFLTTNPLDPKYNQRYLMLNGQNGPYNFNASLTNLSHTIVFCVPWEGLSPFLGYLLTCSSSTTSGGTTTYSRTLPMQSPHVAIFPNTYAVSVDGRGDAIDAAVTDARLFEDCLLAVNFSTLNYATEGAGAFLEIDYAGSANYDTVPSAQQSFSNGEPIDHDGGVLVGQESIQVTAHQLPNPASALATFQPLKGKVSSADMVIDGVTYPAGTILFPTYDLRKTTDTLGNRTADATIQLIQRDIPWNSAIRSDGVVDAVSPAPYVLADLNPLLS